MNTQQPGNNWRSILLLIFSITIIAFSILAAIGTVVVVLINNQTLAEFAPIDSSPQSIILLASSLFSFGLLLMPVVWLSLQRLRGKRLPLLTLPAKSSWLWILILILWISIIIIAANFFDQPAAIWYLPFLHFFAIAIPIFLILYIGANRIPLGSSQLAWGVFGCGMTFSPLFSAILEIFIFATGIFIFSVYLSFNPEQRFGFERLMTLIENAENIDSLIHLIGPLLSNPLSLLLAFMLLSVIVPVIEEIAKSVGIWLTSDRITSPAQGFTLGLLSGAGFALAESLLATLSPDEEWAITLSARAISGSMHMLASGIAGWGIASARLGKQYLRFATAMLLSMILHGVWNAGAVLLVYGGVRIALVMPEFDIPGSLLFLLGAGLVLILTLCIFGALILINRKYRKTKPPLPESNGDDGSQPTPLAEFPNKGGVK